MTERVFTTVLAISIVLLGILLNKYIEPILPERKKAISYMKKFFFFTGKYIFPICFLIFIFIKADFDKFFVFNVCLMFSYILFNIIIDLLNKNRKLIYEALKLIKTRFEIVDNEISDKTKEKN